MDMQKLKKLRVALRKAGIRGLTTNEASAETGMMRPTAERYFQFLAKQGEIVEIRKGSARIRIDKKAGLRDLEK